MPQPLKICCLLGVNNRVERVTKQRNERFPKQQKYAVIPKAKHQTPPHTNLSNRHVKARRRAGFQFRFEALVWFVRAHFRRKVVELKTSEKDRKTRAVVRCGVSNLAFGSKLHTDSFASIGQNLRPCDDGGCGGSSNIGGGGGGGGGGGVGIREHFLLLRANDTTRHALPFATRPAGQPGRH
jgi:uncharacterized membrane protein YgcG